jgi:glycosyltransferase involved in cell wall biosynthesis
MLLNVEKLTVSRILISSKLVPSGFKCSKKPKVTIGVCVKNCQKTIRQVIESIMAQDYPHELIEVILVDGCSQDKTVFIAENILSKSNIKTRIFFENKGLGFARQIVVNNAESDYILWVDGDLILPHNHVRAQVEFMEQNPEVGVAKAKYGIMAGGNMVEVLENVPFVIYDSKNGSLGSKLPGTGGAIYRVKAIRQAGGFDEKLKGAGEDQDAAFRVKEAGWLIRRSSAIFYGKRAQNWREVWKKWIWYGYGNYDLYCKNRNIFSPLGMNPVAGLLRGFLYIADAYRLMHSKSVLLLPFHLSFEMFAWCVGFTKGRKNHCK